MSLAHFIWFSSIFHAFVTPRFHWCHFAFFLLHWCWQAQAIFYFDADAYDVSFWCWCWLFSFSLISDYFRAMRQLLIFGARPFHYYAIIDIISFSMLMRFDIIYFIIDYFFHAIFIAITLLRQITPPRHDIFILFSLPSLYFHIISMPLISLLFIYYYYYFLIIYYFIIITSLFCHYAIMLPYMLLYWLYYLYFSCRRCRDTPLIFFDYFHYAFFRCHIADAPTFLYFHFAYDIIVIIIIIIFYWCYFHWWLMPFVILIIFTPLCWCWYFIFHIYFYIYLRYCHLFSRHIIDTVFIEQEHYFFHWYFGFSFSLLHLYLHYFGFRWLILLSYRLSLR